MKYFLNLLIMLLMTTSICGQSKIELPALICDNMVLQQETESILWGRSEPGSEIQVDASWGFATKTITLTDSTWELKISTPAAGGPYQITISSDDDKIVLNDVLIGEVWLCSGQSNMEMPLEGLSPKDSVFNSHAEILNANYSNIRLFNVTKIASITPKSDCIGKWEKCSPLTAPTFSAVAYFFGKKLYNETKIPIGLINSSWGGTPAESWVSKKWLSKIPEFDQLFENIQTTLPEIKKLESWLKQFKKINVADYNNNFSWNKIDLGDQLFSKSSYDDNNWRKMILPENFEKTDFGSFDGFIWFRKTINLPENWIGKDLTIELGAIDDYDVTYVNGKLIGSMEKKGVWKTNRIYKIPADLNEGGKLIIAVRVNDTGGGGGLYGGGYKMRLILDGCKEELSLSGEWKYLPVAELWELKYHLLFENPRELNNRPKLDLQSIQSTSIQRIPTYLYNGMISPLIWYTIKGVIWYQGESNTINPELYETLFPSLINNWREDWGYDFPFYFVQIAPYRHGTKLGSQYLRDSQRKSLYLKNTGMVVSLDAGDSSNVHPANKTVIGERLALWALANQYKRDLVFSGPLYKSFKITDNFIEISFDYNGGGLVIKENEKNSQFLISGDDKIFKPANAQVVDNKIYVWSEEVNNPCAVRYAWNEIVFPTLFNKEGLPASSFRTDTW